MEAENVAENCEQATEKKHFICGVIEGFYGRPWTTEQRKDLFRKLKKWGMDSYVYAPKDDYKHRAYWRELYTVEEADHLSSLIAAAKEHGIMFYYALSPGLDMTYSNPKEIQTLKRKLDQVSQFGCEAFALLFDDIESELSKSDKEVFQTFGNAQVSVTNEIFTHLRNPKFLFCPTQYCSTRAIPTVHDSEYLNTLGSKLNHDIEIMWTGNKVISKTITLESIQEITEVLRRPPVIWDNLHANDYDQKRVFLGPYTGRSPELIPHLRGVMTNPNCEFHANTIAIHTLAFWSQCNLDSKVNSSLSADIKLETENEDGISTEDIPLNCNLSKNVYHSRIALKNAIDEWLPEFFVEKEAWGPIAKPQPQVAMVMPIIPIIPSINTCMSLTTTTTTSTNAKTMTVPEVNTSQLQALADVCSTVNSTSLQNPISNPVMNSLVSPTKVVTNDDILNPITVASNMELPKKIPISIVSMPIMHTKTVTDISVNEVDVAKVTNAADAVVDNGNANVTDATVEECEKPCERNNAEEQAKCIEVQPEVEKEKDDAATLEDDVIIEEKAGENDNGTVPATLLSDTVNMLDEQNLSPLSAGNEPMECSSSLASQTSPKEETTKATSEDVIMAETASINEYNNSMQVESSEPSPLSNAEMKVDEDKTSNGDCKIGQEDLCLLCDLFYLPFEHGSRSFKLLNEFNWLKANANVLLCDGNDAVDGKKSTLASPKPEIVEWVQRSENFSIMCNSIHDLLRKIAKCANKEICHDLYSYVWDIAGTLSLLNAFVKWLRLGHFPHNVYTYTQGSYTWFSKGWKEAFMSGDQEPWVFRGGLIADLQRLMPVDAGNDLFLYKLPELPTSDYHVLRPYMPIDEANLNEVCTRAFIEIEARGSDHRSLADNVRELIADSKIGSFVTLNPEFCTVAHNTSNCIVGYAAAALDINAFMRNIEMCWVPAMREKYPQVLLKDVDNEEGSKAQFAESKKLHDILLAAIQEFHNDEYQCPVEVSNTYPAVIATAVLEEALAVDQGIGKRLLTVSLATLRANGCFGVHVRLPERDVEEAQYYTRLGFAEVYRDTLRKHVYLGRRF